MMLFTSNDVAVLSGIWNSEYGGSCIRFRAENGFLYADHVTRHGRIVETAKWSLVDFFSGESLSSKMDRISKQLESLSEKTS